MLKEAKLALRVTASAYDEEIMRLLVAGAMDLETAGVILPGTVSYMVADFQVQDQSTLTDPLCQQAIFTYAAMHFGNNPKYDKLEKAYDVMKGQLMHADGYTDYGEDDSHDEG